MGYTAGAIGCLNHITYIKLWLTGKMAIGKKKKTLNANLFMTQACI